MLRSRGDANEVAVYASLGRIPSLQTLDIKLDASDYTTLRNDGGIEPPEFDPGLPYAPVLAPTKEHFYPFDMEFAGLQDCGSELLDPRKGYFKDMFINATLDWNLVQAIYGKLTGAKPARGLPLDRVEIQSLGGGDFGVSELPDASATVMNELHSRWVIQKDWSSPGQFNITELNYEDPNSRPRSPPNDDNLQDLDARTEVIYRRLWPGSADGSNWQNDWHRFPLAPDRYAQTGL